MFPNSSILNFSRRLSSGLSTALGFEDTDSQTIARSYIDFEIIERYLCEEQEKLALENKSRSDEELFIISLMRWFKCDFFKWCNKPACEFLDCDGRPGNMNPEGMAAPTLVEEREGGASRVEVYRCKLCQRITRFPRYNNPAYMLKHSRRGRCGEFANAFGLVLRSLGFDVRYVLDFTDHVWVEVWIEALQRFVHCDPCERALDSPLVYEAGWKKKLTHVLSCSRYGVDDAISRYSRSMEEVITRRNSEYPEIAAQEEIQQQDSDITTKFLLSTIPRGTVEFFTRELPSTLLERLSFGKSGFDNIPEIPIDLMTARRHLHKSDLEATRFLPPGALNPNEIQGRTSGDLAWRQQRGEVKVDDASGAAACGIDENSLCTTGQDRSEISVLQNLWYQAKLSGRFRWFFDTHGVVLSRQTLPELLFELPLDPHPQNNRLYKSCTAFTSVITLQGIKLYLRKEGIHFLFIDNMHNALYSEDCSMEDDLLQQLFDDTCLPTVSPFKLAFNTGGILFIHLSSKNVFGAYPHVVEALRRHFHVSPDILTSLSTENKAFIICSISADTKQIIPNTAHVLTRSTFSTLVTVKAGVSTKLNSCMAKVWVRRSHAMTQSAILPAVSSASLYENFFNVIDNNVCMVIKEVVLSTEGESEASLRNRVINRMVQSDSNDSAAQSCVGFSIVSDTSNPKFPHSALLFQVDGLNSLRPMKGAQTWVLSGEKLSQYSAGSISSPWDSTTMVTCTYFDVGGGSHGDTMHWDGTELVSSSSEWSLRRISLWAGTSLANGVQCEYQLSDTPQLISSPSFTSTEGAPMHYSFDLGDEKRVSTLHVQAGALIDGLTLFGSDGSYLAVGGKGGERIEISLEVHQQFFGFFGGCGGHLHNLGIVVKELLGPRDSLSAINPLMRVTSCSQTCDYLSEEVLQALYEAHGFFNSVYYLNKIQHEDVHPAHFQHNNLPHLTHILQKLVIQNELVVVKLALQTLVAYLKNIHKNPMDDKYLSIKVRNPVASRVLACRGGFDLLAFGPAAFALSSDGLSLQSRWKKLLDRLPGQLSKKDMLKWLLRFIDFLNDVLSILH